MPAAPHSPEATPSVIIALDVTDLERSVAFYGRVLNTRVVATEREGLIFESKVLATARHPGVVLHLRRQFGIRVSGSHPGTLLRISLHEPELLRRRADLRAANVRWLGNEPPAEARSVLFADPDGYEIELFTHPAPLVVPPPPAT